MGRVNRGLSFSPIDAAKVAIILFGAVAVIWIFMIRPYTYDWQAARQTTGTVKTLMSNSNVIGGAYINALITLEGGASTIVRVPLDEDIRAGYNVVLNVLEDADNPARRSYEYATKKVIRKP